MAARSAVGQAPAGLPVGAGTASPAASGALPSLGAGTGAAAAAPAAPKTIWGFFGLSKSNLAACRDKLCQSQFGQMGNSLVTGPVGAVSGGFIPPLCPPAPSAAAIAAMPGGPQGAEAVAAKIKQSEADAKARVAAVEYLGTVDCSHWPEATKALMNALREDPNECVRFAAARVLNSGCCCSKEIIDALKNCVSGEGKDGAPPETSPRVKAAAFSALQNCLMRVPEEIPPEVKPVPREELKREGGQVPSVEPLERPLNREQPPPSTMTRPAPTHMAVAHLVPVPRIRTYEEQLRNKTFAETVHEARHTLFAVAQRPDSNPVLPAGKQSVLHALMKARHDLDTQGRTPPPTPPLPHSHRDSGLQQSSYTPVPPPATRGTKPTSPRASLETKEPGPSAGPSPSASSRKGVLGLMGDTWKRQGDP